MKSFSGNFDGKVVVPDAPVRLDVNTRVHVVVDEGEEHSLVNACNVLAEETFRKVWDNPLDAEYDKV